MGSRKGLCELFLTYKSNAVQAQREMAEFRVMTILDISLCAAFWVCLVSESSAETTAWIDKLQSQGLSSALETAGFPG